MDKQTTLNALKQHVIAGDISRGEVNAIFKEVQPASESRQVHFSQVLYYIGAAIVLIGISILAWQHWQEFNLAVKLLITLGSGIATYIAGVMFTQHPLSKQLSPAFFLMSAILMPLGLGILFDNIGYNVGSSGVMVTISLVLFLMYGISYFAFKKNILLFFTTAFATWLFYALVNLIIGNNPVAHDWNLYTYITMAVGLSYLVLGYSFDNTPRQELSGTLYAFGALFFLGAAITLNGFWEAIYAGLALGIILVSTQLRSRALLVFGTLFLMGYLMKITAKYFSDSLGWPLALVLAGFMLIAVGYFTFYLNRKYLSNNEALRS